MSTSTLIEAPQPPHQDFWDGYRNRRPEDVAETVFRVTIRNGVATIAVEDQKSKK